MRLDQQIENLRYVAGELAALGEVLPSHTHLSVEVGDEEGHAEVNFHGCAPMTMALMLSEWPGATSQRDSYGNLKWVEAKEANLTLTFYVA